MGHASKPSTARFGLFTERQVGIGSAAAALEPYLKQRPGVTWTDVTYSKPGGFLERLPLPGRIGGTLRGYLQTGDALRTGPFDALFFLTHNPAVFWQRAMERTPTLLWTDVTPALLDAQAQQYDHPVDRSVLAAKVKHALVTRTFQRAALCVGWSSWAARSFVDAYGVPVSKTAVVPPGVDLNHWQLPQRAERRELPRLLFVGGDFQRKGGDLLLAVFREHLRGRCELDLVTRDPVAEEPGVRVHHGLTARSPALLALYAEADAFVLPTRGDCFSIASLEAMAMGLPVVISNVGGISDIIEDGATGFLIDEASGRNLREVLAALLENASRRRELGQQGRKRVEERFDAKLTAERLFGMLGRIANPSVSSAVAGESDARL